MACSRRRALFFGSRSTPSRVLRVCPSCRALNDAAEQRGNTVPNSLRSTLVGLLRLWSIQPNGTAMGPASICWDVRSRTDTASIY